MGVTNLLTFLKSATQRDIHLKHYEGKTIAVDASAWLHKGIFKCALELEAGQRPDRCLEYALRMLDLLEQNGVTPLLVFDGARLQIKVDHSGRREQRDEHRQKGVELLRAGRIAEAQSQLAKAVGVAPWMCMRLISELRSRGHDFIIAPYEADPQLALMVRDGHCAAALSEDSDLLAYGCPHTLYKLNERDGTAELLSLERIRAAEKNGAHLFDGEPGEWEEWRDGLFVDLCIASGTDYMPNVGGVGIHTAHRELNKHRSLAGAFGAEPLAEKLRKSGQSLECYLESVDRVRQIFNHALVYDPRRCRLAHLNPLPSSPTGAAPHPEHLGAMYDTETARRVCITAELDPNTLQPYGPPETTSAQRAVAAAWQAGVSAGAGGGGEADGGGAGGGADADADADADAGGEPDGMACAARTEGFPSPVSQAQHSQAPADAAHARGADGRAPRRAPQCEDDDLAVMQELAAQAQPSPPRPARAATAPPALPPTASAASPAAAPLASPASASPPNGAASPASPASDETAALIPLAVSEYAAWSGQRELFVATSADDLRRRRAGVPTPAPTPTQEAWFLYAALSAVAPPNDRAGSAGGGVDWHGVIPVALTFLERAQDLTDPAAWSEAAGAAADRALVSCWRQLVLRPLRATPIDWRRFMLLLPSLPEAARGALEPEIGALCAPCACAPRAVASMRLATCSAPYTCPEVSRRVSQYSVSHPASEVGASLVALLPAARALLPLPLLVDVLRIFADDDDDDADVGLADEDDRIHTWDDQLEESPRFDGESPRETRRSFGQHYAYGPTSTARLAMLPPSQLRVVVERKVQMPPPGGRKRKLPAHRTVY